MIKCVAIDDEPIALSIIQEYCNRYGDVELKCFTSPIAGLDYIKLNRPDIVFLDVEMNSHNGVAIAKDLPKGICVIFTTAYANYALDGFEVDAVDFLHKPIFFPRFEKAMEKAKRFMHISVPEQSMGSIMLKADHKNVIVNLGDVILVEAMDNYVKVYRNGFPTVVSQITMKEIEAMLPADGFVRLHRSFIVAIAYVEKFSNRMVYLRHFPRLVPVGRKYIDAFNNLPNLI